MADAVLNASEALSEFGDAPLYLTQAHDVVEQKLHQCMLEAWSQRNSDVFGLVAAQRVQSYFPGGYLRLDSDRLAGVIEKPGAGHEPSDLVNLVDHVFASWRTLVDAIKLAEKTPGGDDVYEQTLTNLMAGNVFRAQVYEGAGRRSSTPGTSWTSWTCC
jgi:hypothetical protein